MLHGNLGQRYCRDCGRALDIGEVCCCYQGASGIPKDGLRARCPRFRHRSSYHAKEFIVCGEAKLRFMNASERNGHYARNCCGDYRKCQRWNGKDAD